MKNLWVGIGSLAIGILLSGCKEEQKPNIIFILADDLGYVDIGGYAEHVTGTPVADQFHETPNIDSLCASGMKFTNAYAACPVCSPTRASIMTGRHPVRVDITDWIPGARARNNSNSRFLWGKTVRNKPDATPP